MEHADGTHSVRTFMVYGRSMEQALTRGRHDTAEHGLLGERWRAGEGAWVADFDEEAMPSGLRAAHARIAELEHEAVDDPTVKDLCAKNAELRAIIDACHEAIGEDPGSDDETLAEGIRKRIAALDKAQQEEA